MEFRKVHNIMANNTRSVLVVGLGRFGSSVATTLDMMGQDVLAVDKDGELVNRWSSQIATVQADMTDVMALEQINASDFDTAVVAIGDSVEASVITAGNLLDAGISARRIRAGLSAQDVTADALAGVLVTHEHSDHVKGLAVLLRHDPVPVYALPAVCAALRAQLPVARSWRI